MAQEVAGSNPVGHPSNDAQDAGFSDRLARVFVLQGCCCLPGALKQGFQPGPDPDRRYDPSVGDQQGWEA